MTSGAGYSWLDRSFASAATHTSSTHIPHGIIHNIDHHNDCLTLGVAEHQDGIWEEQVLPWEVEVEGRDISIF